MGYSQAVGCSSRSQPQCSAYLVSTYLGQIKMVEEKMMWKSVLLEVEESPMYNAIVSMELNMFWGTPSAFAGHFGHQDDMRFEFF